MAIALAIVAAPPLVARGQEDPPPPPSCDPQMKAAWTLVAPTDLPVGYPGGFYIEANPPGYPDGPYWSSSDPITLEVAGPMRYSGVFKAPWKQMDYYHRFPLRFEKGDVPARITLQYVEASVREGSMTKCTRVLSAVVNPVRYADPRLRYRSRKRFRWDARRELFRVTVTVRGTIRRDAKHPVRALVWDDEFIIARKQVKPRRGVFAASFTFFRRPGGANEMRGRVLYPGDVRETWGCDDVFSSGVSDGCTVRLPQPWLVLSVDCGQSPRYCHSLRER